MPKDGAPNGDNLRRTMIHDINGTAACTTAKAFRHGCRTLQACFGRTNRPGVVQAPSKPTAFSPPITVPRKGLATEDRQGHKEHEQRKARERRTHIHFPVSVPMSHQTRAANGGCGERVVPGSVVTTGAGRSAQADRPAYDLMRFPEETVGKPV